MIISIRAKSAILNNEGDENSVWHGPNTMGTHTPRNHLSQVWALRLRNNAGPCLKAVVI